MNTVRFALIWFVVLFGSYAAATAQTTEDFKKYTFVGAVRNTAFAVDLKTAKSDKATVFFKGVMADAIFADEKFLGMDPNSYVVTDFSADCNKKTYSFVYARGMYRGEVVDHKYDANTQTAEPKTVIFLAIEKVCKVTVGLSAE